MSFLQKGCFRRGSEIWVEWRHHLKVPKEVNGDSEKTLLSLTVISRQTVYTIRGCPSEKNSYVRCFEVNYHKLYIISVISEVIIRNPVFWLVEKLGLWCYNHPGRGDYSISHSFPVKVSNWGLRNRKNRSFPNCVLDVPNINLNNTRTKI